MSQNVWKTTFTLFVIFQITYAWELVCYNGTLSNFKRVSYENAADLITSGYYDINKSGVFYAYGYRGTTTTEGTDVITEALLERMGINVCVVDWATEANLGLIPLANFPLVIAASDVVQAQLAQALKIMRDNGLDPKLVQLFGFSLGAHLIGNAGRTFSQLTNMTVARATGVDPAKPGFDGPYPLNPRLDKTCADFVDIIHTDTNRYGMATAVGHVDCYPNIITYKNNGVQPKCPPVNLLVNGALTPADACSHRFSLNLYIDSLRYKCQLLAAKAANETEWASPDFVPTVIACIGVDIDTTLNGTFYMVTAGQYPYGLNETGLKSS